MSSQKDGGRMVQRSLLVLNMAFLRKWLSIFAGASNIVRWHGIGALRLAGRLIWL